MKLGDVFPNFNAKTNQGSIQFYEWLGESWGILFSHPADFTPVCTTELSRLASLKSEFDKRGIKIIALSCDSVTSHLEWMKDIKFYGKVQEFPYLIIADEDRKLAEQLEMFDPLEHDTKGLPLTARAVYVVDPLHKIRLSLLYPASTGRNFDEILRAVDSLLLTDKFKVATPADWQEGSDTSESGSLLSQSHSQTLTESQERSTPTSSHDILTADDPWVENMRMFDKHDLSRKNQIPCNKVSKWNDVKEALVRSNLKGPRFDTINLTYMLINLKKTYKTSYAEYKQKVKISNKPQKQVFLLQELSKHSELTKSWLTLYQAVLATKSLLLTCSIQQFFDYNKVPLEDKEFRKFNTAIQQFMDHVDLHQETLFEDSLNYP